MRKYRVWLTAALVINLVVLFGFVMNCYQTRKNEVDQRLTKVSADVARLQYVMPVGMPVGLYIHTKGVMVLGTGKVTNLEDDVLEPAKTVFREGDGLYIKYKRHDPSKYQSGDESDPIL